MPFSPPSFSSSCDPRLTDDNIGNVLLIPAAIFIVPSAITTLLRLWARKSSFGSDDWTILVAAILTITLNALSIVGVRNGKGRHVCFFDYESFVEVSRYSWIDQLVFVWALFFIKISICLMVMRVKSTTAIYRLSGMVVTLMTASSIVACIALFVECTPLYAYWNRSSGQCRAPTFRIYSIWIHAGMVDLRHCTRRSSDFSRCFGVDRSDMFSSTFPNTLDPPTTNSEED
jgi:hypothetical protein